jgi:hypothetical protein
VVLSVAAAIVLGLIIWQRDSVKGLIKPSAAPPVAAPVEITIIAWPWAEVLLDGEFLGYTPRVKPFLVLDLVPGENKTLSVDLTEVKR